MTRPRRHPTRRSLLTIAVLACAGVLLSGLGLLLPDKASVFWATSAGLCLTTAVLSVRAGVVGTPTTLGRTLWGLGAFLATFAAVSLIVIGGDPIFAAMSTTGSLLMAWLFTPAPRRVVPPATE